MSSVIVAALLLISCSGQTELNETVQSLEFSTLTGEKIALSSIEGPLLVNFWSTDCIICVREMPALVSLYEDHRDDGFELIAVAMPYDAPNKVLELAEEKQLPFPVALDVKGEAVESFATVKGTPTSYLLDGDGKLVQRYVGAIKMNKLRKDLKKLLVANL